MSFQSRTQICRSSATAYFSTLPFGRKHNCHCVASLHICSIQDRPFGKVILRRQEGEINLNNRLPVILLHSMTLSSFCLDTVFAPVSVRQVCQFVQSSFTLRRLTWCLQHSRLDGTLVISLLFCILTSSRSIKRDKQCVSDPFMTSLCTWIITLLTVPSGISMSDQSF